MVAASTANKLKFIPLNDNVLIEELPRETGMIVIPDGADFGPPYGRVVAVGPGRFELGFRVPTDLEPGDIVSMFADSPFTEVPLGGVTYRMIRSVYLKCKVEGME